MTDQELQQLAQTITEALADDCHLPLCMLNETEEVKFIPKFLKLLLRTHCIVSKEFVNRKRLVIEFDKKQMLEKPIGEKIALAGVYQAKLELMDKLFGKSTFEERSEE